MTKAEKTKALVDRALTTAFREVFGVHGARSLQQQMVLARLRQMARAGRPLFSPTESDRVLAMREGRAEIVLEIETRCETRMQPTLRDLLGHLADTIGENDDDDTST